MQCTEPCLSCSTSPTSCLSCIEGYFLAGTNCNTTCNLPFFAIDRECRQCASPCSTCANLQPYVCTTCETGYYLLQTTCYSQCPSGTFLNGLVCQVCTSGCLTCSGSSSFCLSCYPGLYLYGSNCISSCPTSPTFFYEYQSQCIECQPECVACLTTPVECTACSSSTDFLNLETRECSPSCVSPYYATVDNGINACVLCSAPCKTCTSTNILCSSCYNGKYLYQSSCIDICPSTFYENMNDNICSSCISNCQIC